MNKELYKEFIQLKAELFQDKSFVIQDDNNPKWVRYNQLLAYFHSGHRAMQKLNDTQK
jgi:hypothetical protein